MLRAAAQKAVQLKSLSTCTYQVQYCFSEQLDDTDKMDAKVLNERVKEKQPLKQSSKPKTSIVVKPDKQVRTQHYNFILSQLKNSLTIDVFNRFKSNKRIMSKKEELKDLKFYLEDIKQNKQTWSQCGLTQIIKDKLDSGTYDFISKIDFITLFQNPNVIQEIKVFDNLQYFQANSNFITESEIIYIINKVKNNKFFSLLKFLQYSQYFVSQNPVKRNYFDAVGFQRFLAEIPSSEQLQVIFHFFHLSSDQIIKLPQFIETIPSLGSQLISNLIIIGFQAINSKPMQLFLADIFFGNKSFGEARTALSVAILVLARIQSQCIYMNDLFEFYSQKFGKERFTFYFETNLPEVLASYKNANWTNNYTESLKQYKSTSNLHKIKWQLQTELDCAGLIQMKSLSSKTIDKQFAKAIVDQDLPKIQQFLAQEFFEQNIIESPADILIRVNQYLRSQNSVRQVESSTIETNMKIDKLQELNELRGGIRITDPKKLNFVNRNFFTTMKGNQNESKPAAGQGFLFYLKKAKQIEKDKPQTAQKSDSGQSSFLSQQEIQKIKQAIEKDKETTEPIKEKERIKERSQSLQFTKIQDQSLTLQTLQTKKKGDQDVSSSQHTPSLEIAAPKIQQIVEEKNNLQSKELIQKAKLEIEDIMFKNSTLSSKLQKLEAFFTQIKPENDYEKYCVKEVISQMTNEQQQLGFIKMFHYPTIKSPLKKVDLFIKVESKHGDTDKDFSLYLVNTVFNYDIGSNGYNLLLSQPYKRKSFKRIIAHIAYYQSEVSDFTWNLILGTCVKEKIPFTLIEILSVFMKRNIQITTPQFGKIISSLNQFKNIESEVANIILKYFQLQNNLEISYAQIKEFSQKLVSLNELELILTIYEGVRDALLHRKNKVEKQEERIKLKDQQKQSLQKYIREMTSHLISLGKREEARLVMNDARINKQPFNEEDYLLWLESHINYQEDGIKIFSEFIKLFPDKINRNHISIMLKMVQLKPIDYKEFFLTLMKDYILNKKVQIDSEFVNLAVMTYRRTREFSAFTTFLKFLYEIKMPIEKPQRMLFYKVMNNAQDDIQKSQIKGVLELFDEEAKIQKLQKKGGNPVEHKRLKLNLDMEDELEVPEDLKMAEVVDKSGRLVRNRNKQYKFNEMKTMVHGASSTPAPT